MGWLVPETRPLDDRGSLGDGVRERPADPGHAAHARVTPEVVHTGVRALESHLAARRDEQATTVRGSAGELVHLGHPGARGIDPRLPRERHRGHHRPAAASLRPPVGAFLGFFVAAEFEELGWSGYALDPMQARWNALQASRVPGLVWAVFHCVPLAQHGRSAGWIAWWALSTMAFRVLLTWIYNNTGKSVFAAAMAPAMMNLVWIGPFQDFGPGGYPYHAMRISALLMAVVAVIVTVAWGPRTFARGQQRARAAWEVPTGSECNRD